MRKTIGILQPGRIGDIIISLPIAKYYYDKGYKIVWPIAAPFISFFTAAVDYAQFIPVRHNNIADTAHWHDTAESILKEFCCDKVFDLLFNMEGTGKASGEWKASGLKFDEYRYKICDVPFTEKWNLKINRNEIREQELYNKLVKQEKYVAYQFEGTAFRRQVELKNNGNFQLIEITRITSNLFDWLKILENSTQLVLIDSSFSNIVEQLNMNNKKYFILRSPDIMTPTLRNEWIKIQ